jgi:hypothetical protein
MRAAVNRKGGQGATFDSNSGVFAANPRGSEQPIGSAAMPPAQDNFATYSAPLQDFAADAGRCCHHLKTEQTAEWLT